MEGNITQNLEDLDDELQLQEMESMSKSPPIPTATATGTNTFDDRGGSRSRSGNRYRSKVWEFYIRVGKVDGKERCECTKCGTSYACEPESGTNHLRRHYLKCFGVSSDNETTVAKKGALARSKVWDYYIRVGKVDGKERCECTKCGTSYACEPESGTNHLRRHYLKCFGVSVDNETTVASKAYPEGLAKSSVKHDLAICNLEDLKPHFGKKLKDVELELGVGRSTIKRACREHGIDRWPGNEKQARDPSLERRESSTQVDQQDICMQPSSSNGLIQQQDTNKESTEHPNVEKVMIKVKCREDTIKFELCLSLGVCTLLFEQVSRRLNLKMGSFKLKYLDEDGDEILVAFDDDLHLCHKSQTAMGKTCIQLFVQLIAK